MMDPTIPPLADQISGLPTSTGVYLFKDGKGSVLYVGKAKNLRSRVRSYFRSSGDTRASIEFIQKHVRSVDTILTSTNAEALLLESTLIKKFMPRYNIQLRDDKDFVSIELNVGHPWPMVSVVRRPVPTKNVRLFGPYASTGSLRETVEFLKRTFPLRTCSDQVLASRDRPCLEYQIKRCVAPCVGYVSSGDYQALVRQVEWFLKGKNKKLVHQLESEMKKASQDERFEEAARNRDRLQAVKKTLEKQRVFSHGGEDRDVIGLWREGDQGVVQVLTIRGGRLMGSIGKPFKEVLDESQDLISSFLVQYYLSRPQIPKEILVSVDPGGRKDLSELLGQHCKHKVKIVVPVRGEKSRLVELAQMNAKKEFLKASDADAARRRELASLSRVLDLPTAPKRIECVDLSNLGASNAVGAVVTFVGGKPSKQHYRKYHIQSLSEVSDYAFLSEVLSRRFKRALASTGGDRWELPDLFLVDGGRGQLNVTRAVLEELGLPQVRLVSIAKARDDQGHVLRGPATTREGAKAQDRVFLPGRSNPVSFRKEPGALFLLQRVRDEAHRFAISFHRKSRSKSTLRSTLDELPGIGPKRRKALLKTFGSVRGVARATVEDLTEKAGIPENLAEKIVKKFHLATRKKD